MRKKLFANWGIKLISLLVAFSLWFVVVFFEDPPQEETFVNIPVQFVNTERLTDEGLVYEVLDNTDVVKRVTVTGPQTVVAAMRSRGSECIIATADFADKNMSDIIDIEFQVVDEFASAVTDIVPSENSKQLKLFVEEKNSKSVPIRAMIEGEVAENHQLGSYKTEQTRLTITGGKSKVDRVSYAAVTIDVTGNETDISTIETIRLYDKDGKLLDNSLVQKNINTTKVNIYILDTKVVPVEFAVIGEVAEGYRLTGEIDRSVDAIKITGTEHALAGIDRIVVPESVLDVTGLEENLVKEINLRNYLPSGAQIARDEENTTLNVTVYIEPILQRNYKVDANNIQILNVPLGLWATVEQQYSIYDLLVSGLQSDLDMIEEPSIKGNLDIGAWMEEEGITELKPGVYYIPARILLPENVSRKPVEIRVTITDSSELEE